MEDARFFDLIRYKRADIFEKQLHGLFIYRLDDNGVRRDLPWRGNDEGKMAYPTHFEYEKFELNTQLVIGGQMDLTLNGIFLHSRQQKLIKDTGLFKIPDGNN